VLVLACIDNPKLDSTASHPSSVSHSLPRRIVCHPGHPAPTIMAIYGWSGSTTSVRMLRLLLLLFDSLFRFRLRLVSHQFRPWFRFRP